MNYHFYEIKINLILLHIYINLKKLYNNQILLKDKFNIIIHNIKKFISKNYDIKINILLNLVIYKFLKYIVTIKDSQINTVLN